MATSIIDPENPLLQPVVPRRWDRNLGQIGQAKLRNNARRGGTPNAPEVNDEPAPAANGATGVMGGGRPVTGPGSNNPAIMPTMTATPARRIASPEVSNVLSAPPPGGAYMADQASQAGAEWRAGNPAKAAGIFTRGVVTSPLVALGETAGAFANAARPAAEATNAGLRGVANFASGLTGIDRLPGANAAAQPVPAPTGDDPYKNWGGGAAGDGTQAIASAPPSDQSGGGEDGDGEDTEGPKESARESNPLVQGVQTAPYGSDYNPDAYRQQAAQANQNEMLGEQGKMRAMGAEANRAQVYQDRQAAEGDARIARWRATNGADMVLAPENSGYDDQRRAIIADAAAKTAIAERTRNDQYGANMAAANANTRNPIAEFGLQQDTANRAGLANETINRGRTMTPLLARESEQRITGGEISNKLGQFQVGSMEYQKELLDKIGKAKTPEERSSLVETLLAMRGKQEDIKVVDMETGHVNPLTGVPEYKKVAVTSSGRFLNPQGQTMQGAQKAKLPPGVTAAQVRENAQRQVKNGTLTQKEADAQLQALGL